MARLKPLVLRVGSGAPAGRAGFGGGPGGCDGRDACGRAPVPLRRVRCGQVWTGPSGHGARPAQHVGDVREGGATRRRRRRQVRRVPRRGAAVPVRGDPGQSSVPFFTLGQESVCGQGVHFVRSYSCKFSLRKSSLNSTPYSKKLSFLYFLFNSLSSGTAFTQGPQNLNQNSNNTTFPLNFEKSTNLSFSKFGICQVPISLFTFISTFELEAIFACIRLR